MNAAIGTTVAVFIGVAFPWATFAQSPPPPASDKPKLDIVQTVGCAERKGSDPATWWLIRAGAPQVVAAGPLSVANVDQAKTAALGTSVFRLIGEADFLDAEGLMKAGQRKLFTTAETVNATGQLRAGHKVLVKGVLIGGAQEQRINLISVVSLADSCG
jgi:hypothetical protein